MYNEEFYSNSMIWWDSLSSMEKDVYFNYYVRCKDPNELMVTEIEDLEDEDIADIYNNFYV